MALELQNPPMTKLQWTASALPMQLYSCDACRYNGSRQPIGQTASTSKPFRLVRIQSTGPRQMLLPSTEQVRQTTSAAQDPQWRSPGLPGREGGAQKAPRRLRLPGEAPRRVPGSSQEAFFRHSRPWPESVGNSVQEVDEEQECLETQKN